MKASVSKGLEIRTNTCDDLVQGTLSPITKTTTWEMFISLVKDYFVECNLEQESI